jgi:hypothetical protein
MSTATRPEQTALAVRDAAIGNLPTSVQEQLEMRRLSNQVAGELAKLNWGEKLDQPTRRAVADWGRQFRVDVTTEIHVLGGRIYIGSEFYLRKLAEMVAAGLIEYAYADQVADDKRLKEFGPEGEGEYTRRLRERIMHAIPDEARSATVFRVKLRSMDKEVVGVKWCGTGKKNKYDAAKFADPVGEEFPVETSESRAARRAMRLLASHVPAVANEVEAIETSAEQLSERVVEAKARIADVEAKHNAPRKAIAAGVADDPYTQVATNEQKAHIVEMLNNPALDLASSMIEMYANEANAKDFTASAADALIAKLDALIPASEG